MKQEQMQSIKLLWGLFLSSCLLFMGIASFVPLEKQDVEVSVYVFLVIVIGLVFASEVIPKLVLKALSASAQEETRNSAYFMAYFIGMFLRESIALVGFIAVFFDPAYLWFCYVSGGLAVVLFLMNFPKEPPKDTFAHT